jgi:threonine aldolase
MVFVSLSAEHADALRAFLRARGILLGSGNPARLVTHLDVGPEDVRAVVDAVREFFAHVGRELRALQAG